MEVGQFPIPNRLRLYRQRMGYTQLTVAKLMGLYDSAQVSQWERGNMFPNSTNLIRLAFIFRTIPYELYPELHYKLREDLKALELLVLGK